jgi:hypothetical protein
MNVKQIASFAAAGAVLAAMIAGAATSGRRVAPPPAVVAPTPAELKGAALAAEVTRLRERLRPSAEPAQPARNLFHFGAAAATARPVEPALSAPPPAPLAAAPAPPPLTLVGLAADQGADGPVRTAIIAGYGDLFLVKEGEAVGSQYRVAAIAAEGVELTNTADGTTLRLTLK